MNKRTLIAAAVVVVGMAGSALAGSALAASSVLVSGGIQRVWTMTGPGYFEAQLQTAEGQSAGNVPIPGASITINVPDGGSNLLARFSGNGACEISDAVYEMHDGCRFTILVDGAPMSPAPAPLLFSATQPSDLQKTTQLDRSPFAIERSLGAVRRGTHVIRVEVFNQQNPTFQLVHGVLAMIIDWHLTVERLARVF